MDRQRKHMLLFTVLFIAAIAVIVKVAGMDGLSPGVEIAPEDVFVGAPSQKENGGAGLPLSRKIQVLEELGFTFSQADLDLLHSADVQELGYAQLLLGLGLGAYDEETGEWTPTSRQVYALDMEVFDVDSMYPDFLRGLLSISGGALPIRDVVQDGSRADWEAGSGPIGVSLT